MTSIKKKDLKSKNMNKVICIYALIDSRTNEIRYIGKSKNIEVRLKAHINESIKGRKSHKCDWIRQLLNLELRPILQILEECDEDNWKEREQYWIKYYKERGCKLTNLTEGGDGVNGYIATEETRNKHRENMLRRYEDPKEHEKTSEANRKRFKDPKEREKVALHGEDHGMFGKHQTKESIDKIKRNMPDLSGPNNPMYGRKGKLAPAFGRTGDKHPMYNKHHKQESKDKNSKSMNEYIENHPEFKLNQSNIMKVRWQDPEARLNQSRALKEYWRKRKENENKEL